MDYNIYMNKLIDSLIHNIGNKDNNVLVIKHYNEIRLDKEVICKTIENNKDIKFLFHEYSNEMIQDPYEPFVGWIKDIFTEDYDLLDIDNWLEDCNVYKLQREIYKLYFSGNHAARRDLPLISEVYYEQKRWLQDLVNLFNALGENKKIFVVLSKLHMSNYSTILFLKKMLEVKLNRNIAILITFNEVATIPGYMKDNWNKVIGMISGENLLFDWSSTGLLKENSLVTEFIPQIGKMDLYIEKIADMFNMLSYTQAKYYLDIIYEKIKLDAVELDEELNFKLHILSISVDMYNGNLNKAMLQCKKEYLNCKGEGKKAYEFEYCYILALIYAYMTKVEVAVEFANKCIDIAKELNDDFLSFRAELLSYIVQCYVFKDIYLVKSNIKISDEFYEKALMYGCNNVVAYLYIFTYNVKVNDSNAVMEKGIPNEISMGYNIAKELGNNNLLPMAYLKTITTFSGLGNYDYIDYLYKKCLDLLDRENNKTAMANIYNGIGYNCVISEDYTKAGQYFNSALEIVYKKRQPEEIAICTYNMSVNAFLAKEYEISNKYLELTLKIMESIRLQGLHLCNIAKLYGLKVLCNYYLGVEYNCLLYLDKIENEMSGYLSNIWDVDTSEISNELFLYFLANGLIYKKNGEYLKAQEQFDKAWFYCSSDLNFTFFSYPLMALEQAQLFRILGQEESAVSLLQESIGYCHEKKYYDKENSLRAELNKTLYTQAKYTVGLDKVTYEEIMDVALSVGAELELKDKNRDIEFLSTWQDLLGRQNYTKSEIVNYALSVLQGSFNLDYLCCYVVEKQKHRIIYKVLPQSFNETKTDMIFEIMSNYKATFVTSKIDSSFSEYRELEEQIGINDIATLVGVVVTDNEKISKVMVGWTNEQKNSKRNRIIINDDEIAVIKFAINQLTVAIEKIKSENKIASINIQLKKMSITDVLTGLLNRQGFIHEISKAKSNMKSENVVMYIDLDNFKYHNDSFGHDIGDLILVEFAEVLRSVACDKGYVVRYGGDEFVIVMHNSDIESGINVAKEIYLQLENKVRKNIVKKLSKVSFVPSDKEISCSIGISSFERYTSLDFYDALNRADAALYFAKKNKKGTFMVWNENLYK